MSEAATIPSELDVVVRSQDPSKYKDLHLRVTPSCTVSALKTLISESHPRRPTAEEQVLICEGRVLKNGEVELREVFRRLESGHCNLHLVLKPKEPLPQSSSAPNLQQPVQQTPASTPRPPVVAVPYMMMNPVVSAAYNAAFAAVYQQPGVQGGGIQLPVGSPVIGGAGPSSSEAPSTTGQIQQNQLVPAIAFFPLGIPVLVPAAQNQGFQTGQVVSNVQVQAPIQAPVHEGVVQRRQNAQPGRNLSPRKDRSCL